MVQKRVFRIVGAPQGRKNWPAALKIIENHQNDVILGRLRRPKNYKKAPLYKKAPPIEEENLLGGLS